MVVCSSSLKKAWDLVGGSVVSVYTDGAYKSGALDFVKLDLFTTGIEKVMKENRYLSKGFLF